MKEGKLCEKREFYDGVTGSIIDSVKYENATIKSDHKIKPRDKNTKIIAIFGVADERLQKYMAKRISKKYGKKNVQFIFGNEYKYDNDMFGPIKTSLVVEDKENNIKKYDTPIDANNCNKMEVFIVDHGYDDLIKHPISSVDIKLISNKISDAIANSNGQIQTLTIKLVNCYGRTYDKSGTDLKSELLKDIFYKIKEKAEKDIDFNKLPTILISSAKIDSVSYSIQSIDDEGNSGIKIISFKEYFIFNKNQWEKVWQEMSKNHKENKNEIKEENREYTKEKITNNIENYRKKNQYLIDLFNKTKKEKNKKKKQKKINNNKKKNKKT